MNLEPIGQVKSRMKEKVDEKWGEIVSEIHLKEEYASGLIGFEAFSHVIVIYHMHESSWDPETDLVRRPQGREDMPLIGIFAQRAKHRPNPIGITAVKLISLKGNIIEVQGLDAIDSTPVLDIKPYYPAYDRIEQVQIPRWVTKLMAHYF